MRRKTGRITRPGNRRLIGTQDLENVGRGRDSITAILLSSCDTYTTAIIVTISAQYKRFQS
jgi:hypothetical protein